MQGKLIVIEGTDCSGKETQSKRVIERLTELGYQFEYLSFPCYDTPTGKIVGGPYLGKDYICEGWFPEKAPSVDAKVSSLYYAADRRYNIPRVKSLLDQGINVILDRYFYSNMAHQGGKIEDQEERIAMYRWLESLEIGLLELPVPEIKVFLHVPYDVALELKKGREEKPDQLEADADHLKKAERAYLEIANLYNFTSIECSKDGKILSIAAINDIVYDCIKKGLGE